MTKLTDKTKENTYSFELLMIKMIVIVILNEEKNLL